MRKKFMASYFEAESLAGSGTTGQPHKFACIPLPAPHRGRVASHVWLGEALSHCHVGYISVNILIRCTSAVIFCPPNSEGIAEMQSTGRVCMCVCVHYFPAAVDN